MRRSFVVVAPLVLLATACGRDSSGPGTDTTRAAPAAALSLVGRGAVTTQYTAEVSVRGRHAYTTTWGRRGVNVGNTVRTWDITADVPVLRDSQDITDPAASTTGDVQVSDDGTLLVVATESAPGSIVIYSLANPARPVRIGSFTSANTTPGVHTAEVARVNGTLHAFLSVDPRSGAPARLVIVSLANPAAPVEVSSTVMGAPFVHDVFVRDGILLTANWDEGLVTWDIGGAGRGGSLAAPLRLGAVVTVGGEAHNVWWYRDAAGAQRYAFVGEEGPGSIGSASTGDIHVVDVSDLTAPREVAFFRSAGAGPHNFSMDEARGVLYAAYYNAGVFALDVRGDLSACSAAQRDGTGRCDLALMGRRKAQGLVTGSYVWGVEYRDGFVYASDMLQGLFKLQPYVPVAASR